MDDKQTRYREAEEIHSRRLREAGQRLADLQRQAREVFEAIRKVAEARRAERLREARAAWRSATRQARDDRECAERAAFSEFDMTIAGPLRALEVSDARTWNAYNQACEAAYAEYEATIRGE